AFSFLFFFFFFFSSRRRHTRFDCDWSSDVCSSDLRGAAEPGVLQSVGAANLAAGLQDAWLGRTPVIAFTGHKEPSFQHRNSYQEIGRASCRERVEITMGEGT